MNMFLWYSCCIMHLEFFKKCFLNEDVSFFFPWYRVSLTYTIIRRDLESKKYKIFRSTWMRNLIVQANLKVGLFLSYMGFHIQIYNTSYAFGNECSICLFKWVKCSFTLQRSRIYIYYLLMWSKHSLCWL